MLKSRRRVALVAALLAVVGVLSYVGITYAATSLTTRLQFTMTGQHLSTLDLLTATVPINYRKTVDLTNGTGALQADVIWSDQRTIAASTTEDLDLAGGGLTDAFGTAFAPAKVKLVAVCAASGNTNDVLVGGDANSVPIFADVSDIQPVKPNGCYVAMAPGTAGLATVTAATGDIIQVANSGAGTTVTYDILIIGTSS